MFKRKRKTKGQNQGNPILARKLLGRDAGRGVFGFPCRPEVHARVNVLADNLGVPIYALTEHLLELALELVSISAVEPEERGILLVHIREDHIMLRTIEKASAHNEKMGKILQDDYHSRLMIEKTVRHIVEKYANGGISPKGVERLIQYGLACWHAERQGQPKPSYYWSSVKHRDRADVSGTEMDGNGN